MEAFSEIDNKVIEKFSKHAPGVSALVHSRLLTDKSERIICDRYLIRRTIRETPEETWYIVTQPGLNFGSERPLFLRLLSLEQIQANHVESLKEWVQKCHTLTRVCVEQLFDLGKVEQPKAQLYICSQYIFGLGLDRLVSRAKRLPWALSFVLFELAEALLKQIPLEDPGLARLRLGLDGQLYLSYPRPWRDQRKPGPLLWRFLVLTLGPDHPALCALQRSTSQDAVKVFTDQLFELAPANADQSELILAYLWGKPKRERMALLNAHLSDRVVIDFWNEVRTSIEN